MSTSTLRPGLTAATTTARQLLAAGWRYDSTTPVATSSTSRLLLHPSGREIEATTSKDGESTTLTLSDLSLEQVAGAITGAGLTAPVEHYHVGGVIGGPGENEVECACGLIFGGFDSQAAALAFLDRHIANPEPSGVDDRTDAVVIPAAAVGAMADRVAAVTAETSAPAAPASSTERPRPRRGRVIAEHLEQIASLIRDAELGELPGQVALSVNLFACGSGDNLATVDALTALTGQPAQWDQADGEYGQYRTGLQDGKAWSLACHAFERRPVSTEDQLRAEIAELREQLAQGGTR